MSIITSDITRSCRDNLWPVSSLPAVSIEGRSMLMQGDVLQIVTGLILTPVVNEFVFDGPFLKLAQNIGLLVGAVFWGVGADIWGRRCVSVCSLFWPNGTKPPSLRPQSHPPPTPNRPSQIRTITARPQSLFQHHPLYHRRLRARSRRLGGLHRPMLPHRRLVGRRGWQPPR